MKIFTALILSILIVLGYFIYNLVSEKAYFINLNQETGMNTELTVEEAYEILKNARIFAVGGVGQANSCPKEIEAFVNLFETLNAQDIFKQLEKEATFEGKLYALCAFYKIDKPYYNYLMQKYKESNNSFSIWQDVQF